MKKLLAVLLIAAALLALPTAAFADTGEELMRMQLEIDGKTYTLSGWLKDIVAQGITVTENEVKGLNQAIILPGYWYPASVGEAQFLILLSEDRIGDDVYVSGYRTNQVASPDAKGPGFQLGKTGSKEIQRQYGAPDKTESKYVSYRYRAGYAFAEFTFESDKRNAPLYKVEVIDAVPFLYGPGVSEEAGKEDAGLPAPEDLQKYEFILDGKFYSGKVTIAELMANGWRLSANDARKELEPRGSSTINSRSITMFNGISFIEVFPYNDSTTDPCAMEEGYVMEIRVADSDGVSLWTEGGFTFGAKPGEITEAFEDVGIDQKSDYTNYKVTKNSGRLRFSVAHGKVFAIEVTMPIFSKQS